VQYGANRSNSIQFREDYDGSGEFFGALEWLDDSLFERSANENFLDLTSVAAP